MAREEESLRGAGRSVLVVDDDQAIRNLVAAVLRRNGLEVDTAADGLEAVLKLQLAEYSIIILDLMMPLVCGAEILEYLSVEHPHLLPRIVIMTAAGERELDTIGRYPVGPVVRKPFDIEDLLATVRDFGQAAC